MTTDSTKLANTIQAAIDRSISHIEIVHITVDGNGRDARDAIGRVWDGDSDYCMAGDDGVETMDVWGWDDATPADQMVWRLAIRFNN